jgi:hypothetical protein
MYEREHVCTCEGGCGGEAECQRAAPQRKSGERRRCVRVIAQGAGSVINRIATSGRAPVIRAGTRANTGKGVNIRIPSWAQPRAR